MDYEILITGTESEISDWMENNDILLVETGGDDDDVLAMIQEQVKGFDYTADYENDELQVSLSYGDEEISESYPESPENGFRIVYDAGRLLQPDWEIRLYAVTRDEEAQSFVIAPSSFWKRFDKEASSDNRELFEPSSVLAELWEFGS